MIKIIVWQDKAFTLIEVLISMVIMLIIFLGLIQALAVYTRHNIANAVRDEAVKIAQECAERLRNLQKCTSSTSTNNSITDTVPRQFRNFTQTFTLTYSNPDYFTSGTNSVTITVTYEYPSGKIHSYQFNTVVYKK